MGLLMESINRRAMDMGIPLSVHIDLTWRCNERCIHCYLDHDDPDELSLSELRDLLDQMADAGTLFLTLSGGEIFLRRDLFAIVEHARFRGFDVKLKTNAILIGEKEAARIAELGVHQVQISVYSHVPRIHDAITKVPGSLERTLRAIALLRAHGVHVVIACVLMKPNIGAFDGVQELARELGAEFTIDPTITPHINGDRSILDLNVGREDLRKIFKTESLVGDVAAFTAPPSPADDEIGSILDGTPCSAGHSSSYISPHGDVYPCVQFPLVCGNVRRSRFTDIWQDAAGFREIRKIRARDLPVCSSCGHVGSCSRCPGLAYMEGSMYGPSSADCEKSFVRTGIPSAGMRLGAISGAMARPVSGLVQISTR
jgi:radical SAM protein with 4Fe4S-binding SPASM domain